MKALIMSASFGIAYFWMSLIVDAYPTVATHQMEPASTPLTLFLLGSGLSALSFWGKRTRIEE